MKSLLSYFNEFSNNGIILLKQYLEDYAVGGSNQRSIIMIINNKSTFLANDSYQKVQTLERHRIFRLKGRGKDIMISDFLLAQSQLNLYSFPLQQQKNLVISGISLKSATYFEYDKIEEGY